MRSKKCIKKAENFKKNIINDLYRYVINNNNRKRMYYPVLGKEGYPSGSGIAESACKEHIHSKVKRSGCRWDKEKCKQDVNNSWYFFEQFGRKSI